MPKAKRPLLADPLDDQELQPIHPPPDDFDIGPKPTPPYPATQILKDWQDWGVAAFGSATAGEYAFHLGEEQRKLLWVALLHARGPAHQGQVTLRKRTTVYALDSWGLEVIDPEGTAANKAPSLVIVFVEPPPQ
jgi:hypothetical protein